MADSLISHETAEKWVKKISEYVKLDITDPIIYPLFMIRGDEGRKSQQKVIGVFQICYQCDLVQLYNANYPMHQQASCGSSQELFNHQDLSCHHYQVYSGTDTTTNTTQNFNTP